MMRIIIADDSAMARMFVKRCLEISGFLDAEFIEKENGKEVLESLREQPADLVVTDLNMPGMDGTELLKAIKASPRLFDTPVLVVSSTTNPKKTEELESLGAFAVLGKPISPATLAPAVAPLLEKEEE